MEHDSSLIAIAVHTSGNSKNIFSLFSSCHKVHDSGSLLSDDDVDALGKKYTILLLLNYFLEINSRICYHIQSNFPKSSFLPKMHMLEDHMTSWLRNWRVGCGYESESESLRASFISKDRAYNSMKDRVARLKSVP
jgi:hypothetical protein